MIEARATLWLLALGLSPLGCPLLLDDDFVLVDAPAASAAGGDSAGATATGPERVAACPAVCDECDGEVCVFSCAGEGVCEERMVQCPAGRACQVVCSGKHACAKLRLTCPTASPCTIECGDAKDACREASVTCGTDRCEAHCHGDTESPQLSCGKSAECSACE
jgi:hypothetical protein